MSREGFVLIVRAGLVLSLIVAAAIIRTFTGSSRRRGRVMAIGLLGGMALGVAFSYVIPASLHMRESAVFAVVGMLLGSVVAWFFAREFPREAAR